MIAAAHRIFSVATAVLVACAVLLFLAVAVLPRVFDAELRSVVSGSMAPAIEKDALAVSLPVDAEDVKPGDILMFRAPDAPDRTIVHRVVAVTGEGRDIRIQTKGDANNVADAWDVTERHILGRVVFDVPYIGGAVEALRTRTGFIVLMLAPALLIVFGEAPAWYRAGRRMLPAKTPAQTPSFIPAPRPIFGLPLTAAMLGVVAACAVVAAVAWALAPRSGGGDEGRAAQESGSIAINGARLAESAAARAGGQLRDGAAAEAFAPYSDPPTLENGLERVLAGNSNVFTTIAVLAADGEVLAVRGGNVENTHQVGAFLLALSTNAPAAAPGAAGALADFALPLSDGDGGTWAVLLGRAEPSRIWSDVIAGTVIGSSSAIIDATGAPVAGGLEASPAGLACAEAPVGESTQLAGGWRVRSCIAAPPDSPWPSFTRFALQLVAAVAAASSATLLALALVLRALAPRRAPQQRPRSGYEAIEARLYSIRETPR